jgi:hypothetical protein
MDWRRSVARVALATACVLLVPLVAMQITDEVNPSLADFVLAGALLVLFGDLLIVGTIGLALRTAQRSA